MPILLVGLNHNTAPIQIREQLSLTGCGLQMGLEEIQAFHQPTSGNTEIRKNRLSSRVLRESVILSTCNRLEIYTVAATAARGWKAIEQFLTLLQGIPAEELRPHLYYRDGVEAVEHLMRVASGLDSMILGEPQILGQVSAAYTAAQAAHTTGPILSSLFTKAIHAGKRARSETAISRNTVSVSHAAALLAQDKIGCLELQGAVVVGAGEMAKLAARALQMHGCSDITIMNRTYGRAEALANEVGAKALNWYHLPQALTTIDLVITATGAPHTVIATDDVAKVLDARGSKPLIFIDIAVPRDVDESVGDLPNVLRYDIDDLQSTVDENLASREAAVSHVEIIIQQEADEFISWINSRNVVPVISELRRKAKTLAAAEVDLALSKMDLTEQQEAAINKLAHRLVNKLLHEPTIRLKEHAANGNGVNYALAVRELFDLSVVAELPEPEIQNTAPEIQPEAVCPMSHAAPALEGVRNHD